MAKKIVVQKFGGSSVANPDKIKNVASIVSACKDQGNHVVVVVSALGDTTDELLELAAQINDKPAERELDMLMSTGEQISVALLAMALQKIGKKAISFTGAQVGILTDTTHTKARILDISTKRIMDALKKDNIVIVAGFQGISLEHEITTLGRGGSDMTAVALAKVLKADVCDIFTDVKGVYTADPRIVEDARKLDRISYDEMLELASLGAQVMQARSIEVASKFNVVIHVRSSFSNEKGTLICKEVKEMEEVLVRGVAVSKGEAKITVCDVPDKPGEAGRLFEALAKANINVDMIIQNVSRTGGRTDISFTVPVEDIVKAQDVLADINKRLGAKDIIVDKDIAKVSVVGVGMRSHSGVAAKMFKALADANVNIEMISTSEIKISCVIGKNDSNTAMKVLHKAFELNKKK
ncbi:MAG TPA: aspartate kinase [Candidatus Omnitrophota bacterium]|nr:aspartate kinase [Candidatus Omnitrophota bacterium]